MQIHEFVDEGLGHSSYAVGHVPGARNVELGQVATSVLADGALTVMCGHGERAMTGASLLAGAGLLATRGLRDLTMLDGGPDSWSVATGRPLAVGK